MLALGALGVVYGDIGTSPASYSPFSRFMPTDFYAGNKLHVFVVFGSVVLCLTGAEALSADRGHFGRKAIRLSCRFA